MMIYHCRITSVLFAVLCCSVAVAAEVAPPGSPSLDAKAEKALADLPAIQWGFDYDQVGPPIYSAIAASHGDPQRRADLEQRLLAALRPDATLAGTDLACKFLAQIGTVASVPTLAGMLGDPGVAHKARSALEFIGGDAAAAALRDALPRVEGDLKIGVINSLGCLRDEQAVLALQSLLAGKDDGITRAAITALGRIGTTQAAAALESFGSSAPAEMQVPFLAGCLETASQLALRGQNEAAAKIYERVSNHELEQVRLAALRGLVATQPDQARQRLEQALRSDNPRLVAVAAELVQENADEQAIQHYASLLPTLPPGGQAALLDALDARPDPALRAAALKMIEAGGDDVKLAAARALASCGTAEDVPLLGRLAAFGESPLAAAALASLKQLRDGEASRAILSQFPTADPKVQVILVKAIVARGMGKEAMPALLRAVESKSAEVRTAVLKVLGALGDADTGDGLLRALSTAGVRQVVFADPTSLREATRTLGALSTPKQLPELIELTLGLSDEAARLDAEWMVVSVAMKIEAAESRADSVLATLDRTKESALRCSLLRVLGGIGNNQALQRIVAATSDADAAIRDTALRKLADSPSPQAIEPLLELIGRVTDPGHKALALRGCVRLVDKTTDRPAAWRVAIYQQMLQNASAPDEKKLLLSGFARLQHPEALKLAAAMLDEPAVRNEAAQTAVALARSLLGVDNPQIAQAMQKVLQVCGDGDRGREAKLVRQGISETERGWLLAWRASGLYGELEDGVFAHLPQFPPELSEVKEAVVWRPVLAAMAADKPWYVSIEESFRDAKGAAAYMETCILSEQSEKARLEIGGSYGIKAWFNGRGVVDRYMVSDEFNPVEFKINVTLQKGWNRILIKLTRKEERPWGFCVRLLSEDGKPLHGVRVDPAQHQG